MYDCDTFIADYYSIAKLTVIYCLYMTNGIVINESGDFNGFLVLVIEISRKSCLCVCTIINL